MADNYLSIQSERKNISCLAPECSLILMRAVNRTVLNLGSRSKLTVWRSDGGSGVLSRPGSPVVPDE